MTAIADATDSSTVEKLIQAVEELQVTVEQQADRIDDLEDEKRKLELRADAAAKKFDSICEAVFGDKDAFDGMDPKDMTDLRQRITDIENTGTAEPEGGFDGDTPRVDTDETGSQNDETPLERICRLPEHLADRELTANQERARFIASDVRDYAEKVPAGLVIDSRAIKRVLTAAEGTRPHTQTVARVMDFLDDLGKGSVELKQRRGKKLVVVDPEVADRLTNHSRCDGPRERAAAPT